MTTKRLLRFCFRMPFLVIILPASFLYGVWMAKRYFPDHNQIMKEIEEFNDLLIDAVDIFWIYLTIGLYALILEKKNESR